MTTKMKIIVYTCIVEGYDDLLEPACDDPGIDYVCISDRPVRPGSLWRHIPISIRFSNSAATNRYVKMHPHVYFPNTEISIYVDGNIRIVSSPFKLAQDAMSHASIAMYQHFSRNCIYDEAEECSALGYDWCWRIKAQMNRYRLDGFIVGKGLFEGNVIIRRHNQPEIIRLMESWWNEYINYVRRDQLSLTYFVWKISVQIYNLGPSDPRSAKTTFSLQKIHTSNSALVRLRGLVNRRLLALGFFRIPSGAGAGPGCTSDE
jgi:hypothetical protein